MGAHSNAQTMPTRYSYFAVEAVKPPTDNHPLHRGPAEALCRAGAAVKHFTQLEAIGATTVGSTPMVRFRANLDDPWVLLDVLVREGLGVVGPGRGGATFKKGARTATVSSTTICTSPTGNPVRYRGPGAPHWERQFTC